jgi:hypothetical protein
MSTETLLQKALELGDRQVDELARLAWLSAQYRSALYRAHCITRTAAGWLWLLPETTTAPKNAVFEAVLIAMSPAGLRRTKTCPT